MECVSLPLAEAGPGAGGAEGHPDAGGAAGPQTGHGLGASYDGLFTALENISLDITCPHEDKAQVTGGWGGGGAASPRAGAQQEGIPRELSGSSSKSDLPAPEVNCTGFHLAKTNLGVSSKNFVVNPLGPAGGGDV